MNRQCTPQDWDFIVHCLRVAAGRFEENAAAMTASQQPQLARIFDQQRQQALSLADDLE